MPGRIIMPPKYVDFEEAECLIFLAGPIQGAVNWHEKAIEIIQKNAPEINIASPRRNVNIEHDFPEDMYNEQVEWESYHLKRSGKKGAVLFWLAKENEKVAGRAYAQTSRFELGEWKARHEFTGANLIVGIEEGFSNADYIKRRLSTDCPNVIVCSSLEETCLKAIEKIKGSR